MTVFKEDIETKRVIFNVRLEYAYRLEKAKEEARTLGKKLDIDSAIDKALEKFLKKAEKKIVELKGKGISEGLSGPVECGAPGAEPDDIDRGDAHEVAGPLSQRAQCRGEG